jgi:hypothetical protein
VAFDVIEIVGMAVSLFDADTNPIAILDKARVLIVTISKVLCFMVIR